jgi:hypothetical protein
MDQKAAKFDSPRGLPLRAGFGSLSLARAYIDTFQKSVGSLDGDTLIDAIEHFAAAYEEFPELELDRPESEPLEELQSATENMPDRTAIPVLMYCVAKSPLRPTVFPSLVQKIVKSDNQPFLSKVLCSLRCRKLCWRVIEPVVSELQELKRHDAIIRLISQVIDWMKFASEESLFAFGDMLKPLLTDQRQPEIDSGLLAQTVQSARCRLTLCPGRNEPRSREKLLAMVERLRATPPARSDPHPDLALPRGRMSFDEFLLQWPCEVELPGGLDHATFIEEAYRAILLRGPDIAERNQYLRLLQDGVASESWIIEDLLASEELRSLDRRLRVICGSQVITEPGSSGEEKMPAVTWPWRSAG